MRYHLRETAEAGELRLYDKFGRLCRTLAVRAHSGEAELELTGLPMGLYSFTLLVEGQPVRAGTLVKLP